MTGPKASIDGERALPELIRRQIRSEANRRFLSGLPAFTPEADLPDEFEVLLGELDRADRRARVRR